MNIDWLKKRAEKIAEIKEHSIIWTLTTDTSAKGACVLCGATVKVGFDPDPYLAGLGLWGMSCARDFLRGG